ncbi:hypothetical protein A0G02_01715 [Pectobacterium peruviense]|uniref:Uncharacterized protein n=1 Tax=Pectobacterium peruviense TaxID=2066479 RepID=A0ABX4SAJ0_9GAMM|nr:hypothetical protein [Pectobacterium peruviense]KML64794.1 hypothetical protein G033_19120 [Pectobacterium peruviense]PKX82322.1 hypothetical protein A0G02_01715 [Pectobacterium peruviense]PKX86390.1 hypothetical protein A0G03_11080 [Pectobacterium peruviense]
MPVRHKIIGDLCRLWLAKIVVYEDYSNAAANKKALGRQKQEKREAAGAAAQTQDDSVKRLTQERD